MGCMKYETTEYLGLSQILHDTGAWLRDTTVPAIQDSPAMPDMHYVAILHDVVLAFQAQSSFCAGVGFRSGFQQLIPANGLGADEMFLQIGVDRSRGFLRARVGGDLPGAALVLPCGEERNQSQQLVSRANEPHQATFREAVAGEKFGSVGI